MRIFARSVLAVAISLAAVAAGCSKPDAPNQATNPAPQLSPAEQIARDAMLAAMVRAAIATADVDAAVQLSVGVHEGAVRLTGVVKTPKEREKVLSAARNVHGVKQLSDAIRVDPKAKGLDGSDFALAARVTAALAAETGVNAFKLRASAEDGVVTLRGSVPSASLKATALEAARKTGGVKRVIDKISIEG